MEGGGGGRGGQGRERVGEEQRVGRSDKISDIYLHRRIGR